MLFWGGGGVSFSLPELTTNANLYFILFFCRGKRGRIIPSAPYYPCRSSLGVGFILVLLFQVVEASQLYFHYHAIKYLAGQKPAIVARKYVKQNLLFLGYTYLDIRVSRKAAQILTCMI